MLIFCTQNYMNIFLFKMQCKFAYKCHQNCVDILHMFIQLEKRQKVKPSHDNSFLEI